MSSTNLDITRRAIEAWQQGDLNAWIELFDEDIVWIPTEMPDIKPVVGKVAVLELLQSYLEPWDRLEVETLALEQHGERVLWSYIQTVVQEGTGLTFRNQLSAVLEYRNGLCTHARFYWKEQEARKAIGVEG